MIYSTTRYREDAYRLAGLLLQLEFDSEFDLGFKY
jgi:hypothetical protein